MGHGSRLASGRGEGPGRRAAGVSVGHTGQMGSPHGWGLDLGSYGALWSTCTKGCSAGVWAWPLFLCMWGLRQVRSTVPTGGRGLVSSPGQLTAGATHGSSPPRRLHWVLLGRQLHHPGALHSGAPLFVPGVVGKILSEELCLLQGFTKCPGGTFSRGPGGGQGLGRTLHGRSGARHGGGHVGPGLLQQIPAHRGLKHPRLSAGSRAGV